MRSASSELIAHLNALRSGDGVALVADLFTFTLRTGTILTYTNADVSITWNGYTYLADSVLVEGLRFKCAVGLDVDQQQITLAARPTDTVGGVPFLEAMRNGVFDGCTIVRERAYLTAWDDPPVGSVVLFKGRVGTIDRIGRTEAELTVNSDLVLLGLDMPRKVYTAPCQHVLYDTGCGLIKDAFGVEGLVGSGSTKTVINWTSSATDFKQGTVAFTSGALNGVTATIKDATTSALTLSYPLLQVPATGDMFLAYWGCDHTSATCAAKFNNLTNFLGFPYVPQPVFAV
jgi:uncharacterized phage protein (TIGR02218 family)